MKDSSSYDVFADIINPKNKFCGKECDLNSITFDEYHVMKNVFKPSSTLEDFQELLIHLYKVKSNILSSDVNRFLNESIFNFFRVCNYIKQYLIKKDKLERKVLSSEADYRMIAVNANERLSHFNTTLTKNRLAEQFSSGDPSIIGGWKYNKVFNILAANHALSSVQLDASKVK